MKAYRISGTFQMGDEEQSFNLETLAESEEEATEWVFSVLGSRHRAQRRQIDVESVEQQAAEDVEDPRVLHELEATTEE